MSGAKEFLEYLFGRLKEERPVTKIVGKQEYAVKADGTLGDPVRELVPQFEPPTFAVATLSGIVAAARLKLDELGEHVAFHVESPTTVSLVSTRADAWGRRHVYARAKHQHEFLFTFAKYYSSEEFIILFRSSFLLTETAVNVQRLVSSLSAENSVSMADDGISQVVTVKEGTVTRNAVQLPQEIPLVPWRTFRDAAPVESKFMLRLKGVTGSVPMVALYETDAKWQLDTVNSIATYIQGQLPKAEVIT